MNVENIKNNILSLLETDLITPFTKKILSQRLLPQKENPIFFSKEQFNILTILCDLLMAQNPSERICNPAVDIDKRLALGKADGWRYDCMPADHNAYKLAIDGIEKIAFDKYKRSFLHLLKYERITILKLLQNGKIKTDVWEIIPSNIFFEELLAEVTAIFYSHPLVMEEIGFTGMADTKGFKNIGLNENDEVDNELKSTNQ
jgi:gluconate 2-dehydrogenase gamma chain